METFTIAEAAELTGLTKKAMRHRVDRGQIRAVKYGGVRRISRAELERVGLRADRPATAVNGDAVTGLRHALRDRERDLDELEGHLQSTQRELDEIHGQLQSRERELDQLRRQLRSRERELEELRRHLGSRERELDELRPQLQAEQALRTEAEAQAEQARAASQAERGWRDRLRAADPGERRRLLAELDEDEPQVEVFFRRGWLAEESELATGPGTERRRAAG